MHQQSDWKPFDLDKPLSASLTFLAEAMRLPPGQLHKPSFHFQLKPFPRHRAAAIPSAAGSYLPYDARAFPKAWIHIPCSPRRQYQCSLAEENAGFLTSCFAIAPFVPTNHNEGPLAVQILYHSSFLKKKIPKGGQKELHHSTQKLGLDF